MMVSCRSPRQTSPTVTRQDRIGMLVCFRGIEQGLLEIQFLESSDRHQFGHFRHRVETRMLIEWIARAVRIVEPP